jgi:hypothetical protein
MEVRIHDRRDERDQELVLVADRLDLVVGVEDLALVEAERLDDVLVGVGVDRLLERLAQQELAALRRRDVAVGAEDDVVGGERIGGDEEAEIPLDDPALVVGQAVRILPGRDVARHVHFLRHPVVGAGGEVLLPRPLVLERHQLVDVGGAVDDPLVGGLDAARDRRRGRCRSGRPLRRNADRLGAERGRRNRRRRSGDRAGRGACGVNVLGGSVFFPNQHCGYFLCARIIGTLSAKPKTYQSSRFDFVALLHREP